ncbi:MAG: MFS transporter [Verrucomicrobia bacterium]|nr:MFS transporter [Verrucomicrobiota bacterium]
MSYRKLKIGYFALEALNSLATSYYFFYLFFFMATEYGFTNRDNLAMAALNGFVYMLNAWLGGRFGQRYGYFSALSLGVGVMAASLAVGAFLHNQWGHIVVMVVCTLGMCFTWPNLEALVSERESPHELPRTLGLYNMVWAGAGALAFFAGGALLESLGPRSLFWLPVGIQLSQLLLLAWLSKKLKFTVLVPPDQALSHAPRLPLNPRPIARAKTFLQMAWVANPFAYIAVNTVVAVVPGIAKSFDLTPTLAGVFCSVWFFGRLATFLALWLWDGWHYRFRWFISAYLLLVAGFAALLLGSKLSTIIVAQVAFGMGLGLIYYSSLFYSMDAGEAKAEHGGLHESAIGAGIFGGPAIAGSALYLYPASPQSGTVAVAAVLMIGFLSLLVMRYRSRGSY